ncbi:unnamed protein product [Adineta ricciae]|uniref:Uncharacterized protein n=1 Tax=Adineta ricciae TaxID=249248 RepID=A0A814VUD5_ADIRI|nr:unnamed protein product [Adineta ricciae]CAF1328018.1 unnamed protein product [Adineta ricciae]
MVLTPLVHCRLPVSFHSLLLSSIFISRFLEKSLTYLSTTYLLPSGYRRKRGVQSFSNRQQTSIQLTASIDATQNSISIFGMTLSVGNGMKGRRRRDIQCDRTTRSGNAIVFGIELRSPPTEPCQTLICQINLFKSIHNSFNTTSNVVITADDGTPLNLELCQVKNLPDGNAQTDDKPIVINDGEYFVSVTIFREIAPISMKYVTSSTNTVLQSTQTSTTLVSTYTMTSTVSTTMTSTILNCNSATCCHANSSCVSCIYNGVSAFCYHGGLMNATTSGVYNTSSLSQCNLDVNNGYNAYNYAVAVC